MKMSEVVFWLLIVAASPVLFVCFYTFFVYTMLSALLGRDDDPEWSH
ncbi:MAG TPA: hypothetical protein VJC05_01735 [Candidatus Andersenbacteria bacterium]|nr:hypothetical protein [Candidatus Andersenbacteria bacterium]